MESPRAPDLAPRKTPRQARSAVTVDAIFEATVQVLRRDGGRLTTTRVAERAGVSVGSLYQYFPHKDAVLFGVLERYLDVLADALESACDRSRGEGIAVIAHNLATAYAEVKRERAVENRPLYAAAQDLKLGRITPVADRIDRAVADVLATAADAAFDDPRETASTLMEGMRVIAREAIARAPDCAAPPSLQDELSRFAHRCLRTSARTTARP